MFPVVLAASVWKELFPEEDAGNLEGTGYLSCPIGKRYKISIFVNYLEPDEIANIRMFNHMYECSS